MSNFNSTTGPDAYDRDLNPLAQLEAEREVLRLNRTLTEITEAYAEAARERAKAEVDYELSRARMWPQVPTHDSGTGEKMLAAEREGWMLVRLEREYRRLEVAKAEEKQLNVRSKNILGQLSALQTINANIRHAVANSSGRGG